MTARPFRFAISSSAAPSGAAWKVIARKAEAQGFSTLHVSDHYFVAVTDDPLPAAERFAGMFGLSPDAMLAHPNALIGTVDSICETLLARRERYGFSYITVAERNADAFAPVVERLAGR